MNVILYIGLDVHNDSIAISIAPGDSTEVRRWGVIGGTHDHVQRLLKQRQAAHPDATLQFCYEAGPRGFPLCRFLRGLGHECIIVCPSRVPRRPGDRVKTDRRDADQLARLYRAGELTGIHLPEPEDEALRDLLRSRYQVGRAQHRARQQLKMFLLRHNFRYTGKSSWTPAHLRYLARIKMPFPAQQFALQELMNSISEVGARLERYDAQLAREVAGWRWAAAVRALMSLRGVALINAATLVAELGDLHRFTRPQELMSYLGLVPSEQGGALTQCAWREALWVQAPPAGQRLRAARAGRGRAPLPRAGADHPTPAKAPGGFAQGGDRRGVGSPAAPAPPLPTTHGRRAQESAGRHRRAGARVERLRLGHRAADQTAREKRLRRRSF